jgi:hypothetical protein
MNLVAHRGCLILLCVALAIGCRITLEEGLRLNLVLALSSEILDN